MKVIKNRQVISTRSSISLNYEDARANLTLATLFLSMNSASTQKIVNLRSAAMTLCAACANDNSPESPLDVLLWLRQKLVQEAKLNHHNEVYRACCSREAKQIEDKIALACEQHSKGQLCRLK